MPFGERNRGGSGLFSLWDQKKQHKISVRLAGVNRLPDIPPRFFKCTFFKWDTFSPKMLAQLTISTPKNELKSN